MSHTPGPWGAPYHDTCATCEAEGVQEWEVPGLPGGNHARFSSKADALLVAAAPELLVALKDLLHDEAVFDDDSERLIKTRSRAYAAIAKAEGK